MSLVLLDVGIDGSWSTINSNFQKIEDEINNKVLRREITQGEANELRTHLDMNAQRAVNASDAVDQQDLVTYKQLQDASVLGVSGLLTLEVIARSLNVKESQVIFSTDTVTVLDSVLYIYDASQQLTYEKPMLDGAGEVMVSVFDNQLTTTGGVYTLIGLSVDITVTPEMFGAKGGDSFHDDSIGIQAMFDFIKDHGATGLLGNKIYYMISQGVSVNSGLLGFKLIGAVKSTIKKAGNFSGFTMRVADTESTLLSNFTVDGDIQNFTGGTIGLDISNCSNSIVYNVKVKNTGTIGMWSISGVDAITFENFHFIQCSVHDIGDSGIQIQGGKGCSIQGCSAFRMDTSSTEQGTGIYFKVPIIDSSIDNCYVEDAVIGYSVGSSFVGAKAERISYSNIKSSGVSAGLRLGNTENSQFVSVGIKIGETVATGLGDGVRLEGNCFNNTVTGVSVDGIHPTRGAARILGNSSGNTVAISSFVNPVDTSTVVGAISDTADKNKIIVSQGYDRQSILIVNSSTGLLNTVTVDNEPNSQGEQFIVSGSLKIDHTLICSVFARGEDSLPDDLDTITQGVDGQTLVVTNFSDGATITVTENGNINLSTASFALSNASTSIQLMWNSRKSKWLEVGRSVL